MTTSLNILVLLHKDHLADGEYVVSIDAVQKKRMETVLKTRINDGYCLDTCLRATGKSASQEVDLKNGTCSIKYKIDGALQPQVALCPGEDVLTFYGDTKECRRMIVLVRNPSDGSGTASIAFTTGPTPKFLHRVIIKVPGATGVTERPEEPEPSPRVPLESCGSVSGRRAGDDIVEHVISDFGATSLDEKTEAKPYIPEEPNKIVSLSASMTASEFGQYDVVLSNAALIALARAVGPQDARRLLIGLNVPNDSINVNLRNHTGDVVTGIYESLLYWRNMHYQPDGNHQGLVRMLREECAAIHRNDLVGAINSAVSKNQKLANFLPK